MDVIRLMLKKINDTWYKTKESRNLYTAGGVQSVLGVGCFTQCLSPRFLFFSVFPGRSSGFYLVWASIAVVS